MIIEMPYGKVEINSKEDAIYFIKNRCNNCPHSNEMWSCSSYQAKLCEEKEEKVLQKLRNGWKEVESKGINRSRCDKCVYELYCSKDKNNDRNCPDYKRDAPDGGYYG